MRCLFPWTVRTHRASTAISVGCFYSTGSKSVGPHDVSAHKGRKQFPKSLTSQVFAGDYANAGFLRLLQMNI